MPVSERPREDRQEELATTGHAVVDEALAGLGDLDERDLHDRPAALESVLGTLERVLREDPGTPAG